MADTVSKKNPVHTRRDEEKEMRRQDILDAAERVIAQHGWEQTDFGKVAARARLSRSLVYFYFPTRNDLFYAVCDRGGAELEKRFATVMASRASGLEQCMALGRAYYAFAREEPLYFGLFSHSQSQEINSKQLPCYAKHADEHSRGCFQLVVKAVANGLADGSIAKSVGEPEAVAASIWAFAFGLIQIASGQECVLQENFQLTATQMMEHGFGLIRRALAAKK